MFAAVPAGGQYDLKPDELTRRYAEATGQLKAAQDRNTELTADRQKLTDRVAELQKQLDGAKATNETLARAADGFAERTFFLRSHYAAWTDFVSRDPKLKQRWDAYLRGGTVEPRDLNISPD